MSFEEKNLIKDLKKLSFSSFTPFVPIPEPSSSVSLRWREVKVEFKVEGGARSRWRRILKLILVEENFSGILKIWLQLRWNLFRICVGN